MVMEVLELQTEVWGFLKDPSKSYIEILEQIHADYRAQTTGKYIRGVPGPSTYIVLAQRGNVNKTKNQSDLERDWEYTPFPNNVGS